LRAPNRVQARNSDNDPEVLMEASADRRIDVRLVTDVHANWSAHGESEPGLFSYQLILDDGAVEHVVLPSPEAADVLNDLFAASGEVVFDENRRNLIFRSVR
jgi:hypothetical protein